MKEGEGMTNPAKRAQKRAEQLRIERKKHIRNTVIAGLIIAAVELALLFMLGHAVIHTDRYVTLEDTETFELEDPHVEIVNRFLRGGDRVHIVSVDGNKDYVLMFQRSNFMDRSGEQRISSTKIRELLIAEDRLTVTVRKGTNSIVALSGEAHDYVTLLSYNSYEKTEVIVLGILYGVLQLIWLLGFVIYIGWGFDIWIWESIVEAYQKWRKRRGLPQKQKKERTQKEQERLAVIILCTICTCFIAAILVIHMLANWGKLPVPIG